eukprot:6127653-Pyramimonas_sp.AAC.2
MGPQSAACALAARARHGHCRIDHEDLIWGVECTLVVIGTGGPVQRSNLLTITTLLSHFITREFDFLPPIPNRRHMSVLGPTRRSGMGRARYRCD